MKTRTQIAQEYSAKPAAAIFPDAAANIAAGTCPTCKQPVGEFKNPLSRREYEISGMCQKCQDKVFG